MKTLNQCCQGLETTMRETYPLHSPSLLSFPSLGYPFPPAFPFSPPLSPSPIKFTPRQPLSSLPFPPFISRTHKIHLGGLEEYSTWAPPAGSGAEPQPKSNLGRFSLNIWHLVATILNILLRINWPNLVLEMREILVMRLVSGRWLQNAGDLVGLIEHVR